MRVKDMSKVEIYTTQYCPFCIKAKQLLSSKGVDFTEYPVDGDQEAREKMTKRAGGSRTVPQIFIDDAHIGGCDDLHALDRDGKLDGLLKDDGNDKGGPGPT
jgi:glutaredoxin 3